MFTSAYTISTVKQTKDKAKKPDQPVRTFKNLWASPEIHAEFATMASQCGLKLYAATDQALRLWLDARRKENAA